MNRKQFSVLSALVKQPGMTQREIASATAISLASVCAVLSELREQGYVADRECGDAVTAQGFEALAPYRVRNAVIMAAGLSSRFAPISYEKPKGVLTVRGEVLIERQIRQLKEAGIDDITVVVGYKKEEFFYLGERFGVDIVVNEEYAKRNNNSTIRRVQDRLGNTYICSSDDYFTENPFEPYVYDSYYSAVYEEGPTEEYCMSLRGREDWICGATVGGADSWTMMGHVYWDEAFAVRFVQILDAIYDDPATAPKLWEDIYLDHLDELPMVARKYPDGVIWEFDSLDEVAAFDPAFIKNVDSHIFDNICSVLGCNRDQIQGVVPIKQGLTNLSCRFTVGDEVYVYRHPGEGTDEIISRSGEAFSQAAARDLGLDGTYIHEDAERGWKISRFIEGCRTLDYHAWGEVEQALGMVRTLHESGIVSEWDFDIYEETQKLLRLIEGRQATRFKDFDELVAQADALHEALSAHPGPKCLCHNDFYDPNILVRGDEMHLIDWEYSGMSDYASDLGTFICCSDYTFEEAMRVWRLYFKRDLAPEELFHCVAYTSLASFYWFVWALYKEVCGDPVGEWLYLWYRCAWTYGRKASELAASIG